MAHRLRGLRTQAELSQREVAEAAGVNQAIVSMIETERLRADDEVVAAIERAIFELVRKKFTTYKAILAPTLRDRQENRCQNHLRNQ